MKKVLLLGGNGFVGKNIVDLFSNREDMKFYFTSRNNKLVLTNEIFFDLETESTWSNLVEIKPDIIINAIGYGVIKSQIELEKMYKINYVSIINLTHFLKEKISDSIHWIQIGTAFEYDLEAKKITETTTCTPKSHYGMSKFLASNFFIQTQILPFTIVRPFAMFGAHEDLSKFIPSLILAQATSIAINLSSGTQYRDYFYVKDLIWFLLEIINSPSRFLNQIINVGSNQPIQLKELANLLASKIPNFSKKNWNWDIIPQRSNENLIFHNNSNRAFDLGFQLTPLGEALTQTIKSYS